MRWFEPTFLGFFDSTVFLTVRSEKTSGAWVRRILIWLVATQVIAGSLSVHVGARFDAKLAVEAQKQQTAETPGKLSQPRSRKTH